MMLMHAIVSLDPDGLGVTFHDVFKNYAALDRARKKGAWHHKTWVPSVAMGTLDLAKSVRPANVEWFNWYLPSTDPGFAPPPVVPPGTVT